MKIYRPSLLTTLKSSSLHLVLFTFLSFIGYKGGFSIWFGIILLIVILIYVFLFVKRVTNICLDEINSIWEINFVSEFRHKTICLPINETQIFFTQVPKARGMRKEIVRFKSTQTTFDMEFGINGWDKAILNEIIEIAKGFFSPANAGEKNK